VSYRRQLIIAQLVSVSNAEGCVNNFASLFQLTLLQLAELAMELSPALFVPASSAVEAAATCVHFDIHILSIAKDPDYSGPNLRVKKSS
jgi:hypothetical protein